LDKILADYISLRRQKTILDKERCLIIQEKYRVQKLMEDMHNAVNTYNAFQRPIPIEVPVKDVSSATFHQNPSGKNLFSCLLVIEKSRMMFFVFNSYLRVILVFFC